MNVEKRHSPEWDSNGIVVLGGTASTEHTVRICRYLKLTPGQATVGLFPDG